MEIRKLEAFCRVFETQSFSRAGQGMFLSQPTISAHISSLETEFGVTLFDRVSRSVIPTLAGEVLYKKACELFRIQRETKSEIDDLQNRVSGMVVLGGSTIPANYFFPAILADFQKRYANVTVDLRVGDSNEICDQVLAGNLDMGIVGGYAENPDLDFQTVMRDELVIVASPSMGLDFTRVWSPEELAMLPWVQREKGSGTRLALEKALARIGEQLDKFNTVIRVQNTEAMVRCIHAGLGVGVTSRMAVEEKIGNRELIVLEVQGVNLLRDFFLIRHKRRTEFPATRTLVKHIFQSRKKPNQESGLDEKRN